VPQLMQIK